METIRYIRSGEKVQKTKQVQVAVFDLCNGTGFLVCICLISYFLVMRALGVHEILYYRVVNFLFLFSGIIICLLIHSFAIKEKINYFKGLRMGLHVTVVAVIPFAAFMFFYLTFDDTFMDVVEKKADLKNHICPGIIAWILTAEGICSGIAVSLLAMQFLRKKSA